MLRVRGCLLGMLPHGTQLPCCEEAQANEEERLQGEEGSGEDMPSYPPAVPAIPVEARDL